MNTHLRTRIEKQQRNEITEYFLYNQLAQLSDDPENASILRNIALQEKEHYEFWKSITGKEFTPSGFKIKLFIFIARLFGLSFTLRLMEKGEEKSRNFYSSIATQYPEAMRIYEDEQKHEQELIDMLNDTRLQYAGAIVLGLNDALVEFTGTLAGLTFAFQNNIIVGATGLVMGIAASLSMAASGYLASREDEDEHVNPVISAIYTGVAYILTVVFLVLPYFIQPHPYVALVAMLVMTIAIIAGYTFYISVAKNISFQKRFWEMALISLGVAVISFGIGTAVKYFFGVDVE